MQLINVALSIPIPADSVLISKVEWEELKKHELIGVYWSMKDLESRLNRKHEWIKENILYPSHFRRILDIKNGGFVYYPEARGESWSFLATKMADFLDEKFAQIFS